MAEYEIGSLARSLAGHDKGEFFIIIKADAEYVYLADGRLRGLEKPKRKKKKHIQQTHYIDGKLKEKLMNGGCVTDEEIKYFIKSCKKENQENPGR